MCLVIDCYKKVQVAVGDSLDRKDVGEGRREEGRGLCGVPRQRHSSRH